MPDEGLRFEAWTMPHVGTLTRKFDFSKYVAHYDLNDRFNDLCDGKLYIPDDFPLNDELFKVDEANHVNDVGSMVRVLRGTTPLMHFMVTRTSDKWSDTDPTQEITLEGLEWLLDRATVPHYDHPADPTVDPDWIYGADTVLGNSGLESSPQTKEIQRFYHTQASGTYTITYSGQTTSPALDFDADWFELVTALEALSNIQDVTVSGAGTIAVPFEIEFLDPSGNVALMTTTATGGVFTELQAGGVFDPSPWTTSFNPSTGEAHGTYTTFAVSTAQAHTGTSSLLVNAAAPANPSDYPGVQQLMNVTPGRTYRANIWVRPTFSGRFRLVIRTTDETFIAQSPADGTALTANVWTQLTIDPFIIPAHVTQIIYRLGLIESTDLGDWYVDDGVLAPGFPEATLGEIMNDLRTAALAQGVLAWITPTWTDSLDSDGVAWDRDLKWFVNHDQSFLQLFEYARRWNYEFRIRWDVADARFEWDMWNPSGGGQTRANIALTGKSGVSSSGPIVKKPPDFTYMRVEGERGRWGEFASPTLDDVWGRLEKTQADRQGVESTELDEFAERIVSRGQDRTGSRSVQIEDPSLLPWTSFEPGDIVTLNLAPKDDKRALRIAAITASMSAGASTPVYEVHFTTPVLTNEAAMAQGLRWVLRQFAAQRFTQPAATVEPFVQTCCPSCPANAVGVLPGTPMVTSFTTLDWQIDNDPDDIVILDSGAGLHLVKPGLYTIHLSFEMRWTLGTLGLTTWRLRSQVSGNDAGQDIKDWLSFRPTTGVTFIQTSFFHYGHVLAANSGYSFDWDLLTSLSSGVVTAGTGLLVRADLTVVRHSDGCARDPGSA